MLVLLSRELRCVLNSVSGLIFILIFLTLCAAFLWIIPGDYHIPDNGYASLSSFFVLAPILFMLLIPAISMRSFSEERRTGTLSLLYSRPVRLTTIILSKALSVYIVVLIALIPTFIYVVSVYCLGSPAGNVDLKAVAGSYLGLLFLSCGFVFISIFASSVTSSQVTALIISLILCFGFYYGFDLVSGLFTSGASGLFIKKAGFLFHYQSVQRGLINSGDLFYALFVTSLFFVLTLVSLRRKVKKNELFVCVSILVISLIFSFFDFFRIDFTRDKRYTVAEVTKELVKKTARPVEVDFYLGGNLNSGFSRLQKMTMDWLNDFADLSSGKIKIYRIDPAQLEDKDFISALQKKGIKGVAVNEKESDGKISQQIVYPWVVFRSGEKELPLSLLVNEPSRSGRENLNVSSEMLEYQLAHAVRMISNDTVKKIAFLYGHSELEESYLSDTWDFLAQSYQVDAGILSGKAGELDGYGLVILAGPKVPLDEREKYILDQYLMQGGKLILFINGVVLDQKKLNESGESPSMANEVGLEDMLFTYGVRVNPVLIQDIRCLKIPVRPVSAGEGSDFIALPWYYAPLLTPSFEHPVTKGLPFVSTEYASTLSFVGENLDPLIKKEVLLSTSGQAHVINVPEMISLQDLEKEPDKTYFNEANLTVAAILEGTFTSVFNHRMTPSGVDIGGTPFLSKSDKSSGLAVIASEGVIRNEVYGSPENPQYLPLGYDRYSNVQYGNREFVRNLIEYFLEDADLIRLRAKSFQLQLLDKTKFYENRVFYLLLNVLFPILFILFLFFLRLKLRRLKYRKNLRKNLFIFAGTKDEKI